MKIKVIEQNEPYQKEVRKKHKKMKFRLIGKGKNKKLPKKWSLPDYTRSKSAPPMGEEVLEKELDIVVESYVPHSSLSLVKESLNSKFWNEEMDLSDEVIERLEIIARDFFKKLDIGDEERIVDITFTGSLANYNWTDFSDIDLHIIVDFKEIDENPSLVKKYFDAVRVDWNRKHEIMIRDHEVEIYVQDMAEPHASTGVYSILRKKWIKKPVRRTPHVDEKAVFEKTAGIVDIVSAIDRLFMSQEYEIALDFAQKLNDKIRRKI
jgi:predicted nucleotidyltransferase